MFLPRLAGIPGPDVRSPGAGPLSRLQHGLRPVPATISRVLCDPVRLLLLLPAQPGVQARLLPPLPTPSHPSAAAVTFLLRFLLFFCILQKCINI